ncbi:sensor histidine kinase [Streptomyces puniciscabiei]
MGINSRPFEASYLRRLARGQQTLRLILAALTWVLVLFLRPQHQAEWCLAISSCYLLGSLILLVWPVRDFRWANEPLAPWADLTALTAILTLSGGYSYGAISGTFQDDSFFVIPVLAAFQLARARTLTVTAATAVVYVLGNTLLAPDSEVAWFSTCLEALFIAALGTGCVWLSHLQRSRAETVSALAADRSQLISQVMTETGRERRLTAEALHDGPLQSVLAATLDLDQARTSSAPEDFERVERALRAAAVQLRGAVTELHPEVLEHGGLGKALCAAARNAAQRGGLKLELDVDSTAHYPQQQLLYGVARELLTNVVRHAQATKIEVRLGMVQGSALLEVTDDGGGVAPDAIATARARGHIGLASHRVRIEDAGGRFAIEEASPSGTRALVELPASACVTGLPGRGCASPVEGGTMARASTLSASTHTPEPGEAHRSVPR